jgi:hypothetical protein
MNLSDPAIAAPVDPIFAAIEARIETPEAKIAIWKDCERLLRKLMH